MACAGSSMYKSPSAGQSLDSINPINIEWDTSCVSSGSAQYVDIYVYAINLTTPLVQEFVKVPANGSFTATFKPKWWNSTPSAQIKLLIVEDGQPIWTGGAQSPSFTLTYNATQASSIASAAAAADTSVNDGSTTQVYDPGANGTSLSKGAIAAAVLIPLLFALALIFAFTYWRKMKTNKKRQRWSEHFDNRRSRVMSTVSVGAGGADHIRPLSSVGGQQEWRPRASMVSSSKRDTRTSSFFGRPNSSYDNARATSVYSQNQAGVGARKMLDGGDFLETPEMRQTRTSAFFGGSTGDRNSHVSSGEPGSATTPHHATGNTLTVPSPASAAHNVYDYNNTSGSPTQNSPLIHNSDTPTSPQASQDPFFTPTSEKFNPFSRENAAQTGAGSNRNGTTDNSSLNSSSSFFPQPPAATISPDDAMRAYAAQRQSSVRHAPPPALGNSPSFNNIPNHVESGPSKPFEGMRAGPAL